MSPLIAPPVSVPTLAEADAVVVGSGPNGLVAANLLADAGWSVTVLERNGVAGGAVRTAEVTAPGFRNDLFSAFYPLAAASPVLGPDGSLDLSSFGLRWSNATAVLAHPRAAGPAAMILPDVTATSALLDAHHRGDGARWEGMFAQWTALRAPLIDALFTPFPPVRATTRLMRRAGWNGMVSLARLGLAPVRRVTEEEFGSEAAALLLAGCALHSDLTPDAAGSGFFGWLLCMLAQDVGFPVPVGGAQSLTDALVQRLESKGGVVHTDCSVTRIVVEGGRAIGVDLEGGGSVRANRAVLADVGAPQLYASLVGLDLLPPRIAEGLARFQYDSSTVKVDWALSSPIPWRDEGATHAGTVHVAPTYGHLSRYAADLADHLLPAEPFLLVGQMTTADPTRSPAGTEAAWAYTHVPQRIRGDASADGLSTVEGEDAERYADRMEEGMEALAPGFRDRIVARHLFTPATLESANPNLVGGAVNGGTAQLHQQLVFRPMPGLARPETPIAGLFLASASAHPGGGVHGACGANAARAALFHDRVSKPFHRIVSSVGRSARRNDV